jgi:myosin heavy subunit
MKKANLENFIAETRVWIRDPKIEWIEGQILEYVDGGKQVCCSTSVHGNILCDAENVHPRNIAQIEMTDNLKDLTYLDEPNVSCRQLCHGHMIITILIL